MKNDLNNREKKENGKKKSHSSAANIDAIITSATDAARSHRHTDTWSNQGANISYEGATSPAGGGSVGTGQASGQDAVDARIEAPDPVIHQHKSSHSDKEKGEDLLKPEDK